MAVYGEVDHGRSRQRWTLLDNNGQQSAVLHASLMPFLYPKHIYPDVGGDIGRKIVCQKVCKFATKVHRN